MEILKRIGSYPYPFRYFLYQKLRKITGRSEPKLYHEKIKQETVERTHYAYCIYEAARQAKLLGYDTISVLEFGVAGGNGLVNIESHVQGIAAETGMKFEVYGFDMGTGLPPPTDYRDLPYAWSEGFYRMDREKLEARLKIAKLVIGNVSETAQTFFAKYNPAPIGAVMFDLDYYSSTMAAFQIFQQGASHYLPRVQCYFDDVGTIPFVGELLAIDEFNRTHPRKKIGNVYTLQYQRHILGERIFEFHDFDHPKYNTSLFQNRQNPLKA
jgi:hypothetical protein